jgi:hypothetical protein
MNINFTSKKTKNSDRIIIINGQLDHGSICYDLTENNEFKLIKDEQIILDDNWVIKTDHNGKIYEQWEYVEPKPEIKNETMFSVDEILNIIKPMFLDIENKIISLTNKSDETNINNEPVVINNQNGKINILISAICFINRNKQGAEIYASFANRLLVDVMNKTPYDFRIITNESYHFDENKLAYGDRVIVVEDKLIGERLTVGPFNQLLKYKTMLGVDKKYNWLLYLDCDAGFTSELDIERLEKQIRAWEVQGYDFLAARTNAVLRNELRDHENKKNNFLQSNPDKEFNPWIHGGNLFSAKFIFYNITPTSGPIEWGDPSKWMDSKLPSEHVWLIKNNEKLEKCGKIFKSLNEKFETQSSDNLITWDMEAFEVGVSSKLAGYNMGELGNEGEFHILKIGFNFNNWEKVKY